MMTQDAEQVETVTSDHASGASLRRVREFDGVICFGGEDWWYHNRGHYDMQMMREISRRVPVLYVNSIGMRMPTPGGGLFARKIARKLKSFRRGLVHVRERFSVFSPVVAPAGMGAAANSAALAWQVRRAAKKLGITRPLVWVACPPAQTVVDRLGAVGMVYQRTDRFEEFAGVDPERIRGFDLTLKRDADLTVFCSSWLHERDRHECVSTAFIDHGVDYDAFESAGLDADSEPADAQPIGRPRAGFIGGIDSHTFDPELFSKVVELLPDVEFMMVGACSLPEGWCPHPNVHMLGRKPYDDVPGYMAASDVLLMPWNQSDWIKACNPVKLKEYLAVGRPIVSTPFPELERYSHLVRSADSAEAFASAIRAALETEHDPAPGRDFVREKTWHRRGETALEELAARDLVANPS